MTRTPDLQHVSYAVRDALAVAEVLRSQDGAVPVAGETLEEFRYVLLHLGGPNGGYLEVMEPRGDGFLDRFLAKHGEGPHHLTWMVPDLEGCVAAARTLGFTVVGEDYGTASWQEAFIAPHPATGCVIQLARSDREYPTGEELASWAAWSAFDQLPATGRSVDDEWWLRVAEVPAGPVSEWGGIRLRSTDTGLMRSLFVDVLGGEEAMGSDATVYRWPGGRVRVEQGSPSGIEGVVLGGSRRGAHLDPSADTPSIE